MYDGHHNHSGDLHSRNSGDKPAVQTKNAIAAVQDEVQREILERRYLLYQPFVSGYNRKTGDYVRGIAEDMHYSERQIYRLHGMALLKINVSECQ